MSYDKNETRRTMTKENNCRVDETDEEGQESCKSNFVLTSFVPAFLEVWEAQGVSFSFKPNMTCSHAFENLFVLWDNSFH